MRSETNGDTHLFGYRTDVSLRGSGGGLRPWLAWLLLALMAAACIAVALGAVAWLISVDVESLWLNLRGLVRLALAR